MHRHNRWKSYILIFLRLRKTLKYILLHKNLYVFDLHTHTHKISRKHIRITKVRTYHTVHDIYLKKYKPAQYSLISVFIFSQFNTYLKNFHTHGK